MAIHSSVLAWRIPGTAETGGLPSMGSHRVRHNWSDLAAAAAHCLVISFFLFFFGLAVLADLSSPTKKGTWALAMKAPGPNH